MKFLFIHHRRPNNETSSEEPQQEAKQPPSGEIVSQITFGYKELKYTVMRLYDAASGKYSVIARLGDWEQVKTGMTENQAEEYEDGIYALIYPEVVKA
jgi:hypothetical protein